MKTYPITDSELGQLFTLGILATICFSLSAGIMGIAIDVTKDLALSTDTPKEAADFWDTIKNLSYLGSFFFLLVGGGITWFRRNKINQIKESTKFEENLQSLGDDDV